MVSVTRKQLILEELDEREVIFDEYFDSTDNSEGVCVELTVEDAHLEELLEFVKRMERV